MRHRSPDFDFYEKHRDAVRIEGNGGVRKQKTKKKMQKNNVYYF